MQSGANYDFEAVRVSGVNGMEAQGCYGATSPTNCDQSKNLPLNQAVPLVTQVLAGTKLEALTFTNLNGFVQSVNLWFPYTG